MAVPIRMPDLGTTVEEFPLMNWLVSEGETISLGDPLAEIETDKAVTLLESPAKGVLLKLVAQAGEIVRKGEIVAYVGAAGEVLDAPDAVEATPEDTAAPQVFTVDNQSSELETAFLVRNLASSLQVSLGEAQGTGSQGAITRDDVLRAAASGGVAATERPVSQVSERLSRGQLAVARNVVKSWTEIPHLYMSASIDMTATQRRRDESAVAGMKISYDALILQALSKAIRAMPLLAAKLDGEQIVPMDGVHLALAIGIDNDLYLPVIRDVDTLSLSTLQKEISTLVTQVKAKTIPADRLRGGCMALSNLGMYPVDDFDPIIFPEHSAILAVGAIQPTPIAVNGMLGIRPIMKVRLAVDHRLINGRTAAAFISKFKAVLEEA